MSHINTVSEQAFHYFSRPHAGGIRCTPVTSRCAWVGADLMKTPELWTVELNEGQIEEAKAVVSRVVATGKRMEQLIVEDFVFVQLAPVIDDIKMELIEGLGFKLVRNFPVQTWSQTECEIFFWGWGLHLGTCGAQDNSGELLGHVMDTGADPAVERQYKTRAAIDYHCDACDAVGLMCLATSNAGGESSLVSTATAYNQMLALRPALVDTLYTPFLLDTRNSGGIQCVPIEPVRHGADGKLRTFWHNEYFRSCYGKLGAPAAMPEAQLAAWQAYDAIIHDKQMAVTMQLRPGDVQMCSNHTIVHARTAYEDDGSKRHLLRLWLSVEGGMGITDQLSKLAHKATVVWRFVHAKLSAKLIAC